METIASQKLASVDLREHTYHKIKIGIALTDYIRESSISDYPALYIGSDVDLEFPLVLQARKIIMLDPCFQSKQKVDQVINKANLYTKKAVEVKNTSAYHTHINFSFDFGRGQETTSIDLIGSKFEDYRPILPLGYIIEFNGILQHTLHKPEIIKKLKLGGLIINNNESPLRQKSLTLTDIMNYGQNIDVLENNKARAVGLNTIRIPEVPFAIYQKYREEEQLIKAAYKAIFN